MANKRVVFIKSVAGSVYHPADSALPVYQKRLVPILTGGYTQVEEFEDVVADWIISKGWAIDHATWESNPNKPPLLRYPRY